MDTWLKPKYLLTSPCIAAKYLNTTLKGLKINVQRSSLDERVEPEANAGRKIPFHIQME